MRLLMLPLQQSIAQSSPKPAASTRPFRQTTDEMPARPLPPSHAASVSSATKAGPLPSACSVLSAARLAALRFASLRVDVRLPYELPALSAAPESHVDVLPSLPRFIRRSAARADETQRRIFAQQHIADLHAALLARARVKVASKFHTHSRYLGPRHPRRGWLTASSPRNRCRGPLHASIPRVICGSIASMHRAKLRTGSVPASRP